MPTKTDPKPEERHRRMAAHWWYPDQELPDSVDRWIVSGEESLLVSSRHILPIVSQLIATVERDATLQLLGELYTIAEADGGAVSIEELLARRRALLPEPPRGEACTCTADLGYQPGGEYQNPVCPVHNTKER